MSQRTCSEPGCERSQSTRGFCGMHYMQRRRAGLLPNLPTPTVEQRFWAKVERTETCWLWTGNKTHDGYGQFFLNQSRRHEYAHRFAYEMLVGPIPEGLKLDHRHTCPKACVNPEHLKPATKKQDAENLPGAHRDSITGVRGVHPKRKRFRVRVHHNGKTYNGGCFDDIATAEKVAIELRNRLFTRNGADRATP